MGEAQKRKFGVRINNNNNNNSNNNNNNNNNNKITKTKTKTNTKNKQTVYVKDISLKTMSWKKIKMASSQQAYRWKDKTVFP